MTTLTIGTENQIAYANDLRVRAINELKGLITINKNYIEDNPEYLIHYTTIIEALENFNGHSAHMIACVDSKHYITALNRLRDGSPRCNRGWKAVRDSIKTYNW